MRPLTDPEVARWLAQADIDRGAAEALALSGRPELGPALAFHCQQDAEKIMKATLVRLGIAPPKTHDLVYLLDLLVAQIPALHTLGLHAAALVPFAVLHRYPTTSAAPTAAQVQGAIDSARAIRNALIALS